MRILIGIQFYMTICKLPNYAMYWEKSCYEQPLVFSNISRQRFDFIKSNFLIYDVKEDGKLNDSTLPDKSILYLNSLFQSAYSSSRNLSIDDVICLWRVN